MRRDRFKSIVSIGFNRLNYKVFRSRTSGSKDFQKIEVRHVNPLASAVCQVYCNQQEHSILLPSVQ